MRVCHIISGDLWAGAEVMSYRLIKGLQKHKDLELSAILLNDGMLAKNIRNLGVPVFIVDEMQLSFLQIVQKVSKAIKQIAPDIIHSHRIKENMLAFLAAKKNRNIQLICTQHGMPEPFKDKIKSAKQKLLNKLNILILKKYFKYVIVVSEDIYNIWLNKYFFEKDKLKFIYNGTDIPTIHSTNKNKEKKHFVIGAAGRLSPIKDYPLMVEIAHEIFKKTDQIRFELAGEGPEAERILGLIRAYKIEKIFTLRGFIENMEIFYQGLDLYINTSIHEGLPMSVLEAMGHGLPVIGPDAGGLKEILTNEFEGYLIEERNPKAFAEKCLDLYEDQQLCKKMGNASKEKIQNRFSLEKMAEEYQNVYFKTMKTLCID